MFTHIMVGTNDLGKAKKFYDAIFAALGAPTGIDAGERLYYSYNGANLGVGKPANGQAATPANGGTIGLAAADAAQVDAFHAAGLANEGTDAGAPGLRQNAPDNAYGAYLLDPDGNKFCVFFRSPK